MTERRPFNLKIDTKLAAEIKIQAIRENRTVSDITEQLYQEYLERAKKVKVKSKQ
jgi:hypothetical protein